MCLEADNMRTRQEKKPSALLLGMHNIAFIMSAGKTLSQKKEFGIVGDKHLVKKMRRVWNMKG